MCTLTYILYVFSTWMDISVKGWWKGSLWDCLQVTSPILNSMLKWLLIWDRITHSQKYTNGNYIVIDINRNGRSISFWGNIMKDNDLFPILSNEVSVIFDTKFLDMLKETLHRQVMIWNNLLTNIFYVLDIVNPLFFVTTLKHEINENRQSLLY